MNNKNKKEMEKINRYAIICSVFLILLPGCGGMDETFREFIKNGEIVYAGIVDSVKIYPGRNRVRTSFCILDPTVARVGIYWNNQMDSVGLDVNPTEHPEPYQVDIAHLDEGVYSFEYYTYNEEGDVSMRVDAVAQVYGDEYEKMLLETPVKGAFVVEDNPDDFEIVWGVSDKMALGSELIYTGKGGEIKKQFVPVDEIKTLVTGYKSGTDFWYRTFYLPDPTSIDTFATALKTSVIKGLSVAYDKSGWQAYGEDYDRSNPRKPVNAIDNNLNTIWVMDKTTNYPHSMWVDMGRPTRVSGFSFAQNEQDKPFNQIELQISNDGENWETLGDYFLEVKPNQEVDLIKDVTCRYFQLIVKSDHKRGTYSSLKEIGAYYR